MALALEKEDVVRLRGRMVRLGAYLWSLVSLGLLAVAIGALLFPQYADIARYKLGVIDDRPAILDTIRIVNARVDASTPPGSPVFLGDSITMALPAAAVSPGAVNFAIGGQTSEELLQEAEHLSSVKKAGELYVLVGTNDVLRDRLNGIEDRYRRIIHLVPNSVPVIMSSPPPSSRIDPDGLEYASAAAARACNAAPNCRFVDLHRSLQLDGRIQTGVLLDDGIHLSPKGVAIWMNLLRNPGT